MERQPVIKRIHAITKRDQVVHAKKPTQTKQNKDWDLTVGGKLLLCQDKPFTLYLAIAAVADPSLQ